QRVGDRLSHRQRLERTVVAAAGFHDLLERRAADVLHHDEALVPVLDEVVDRDDAGVVDGGEEALLDVDDARRFRRVGVEEALEHHPAVVDVAVGGEVDPAEAAVGEAAAHLVLARDERAGGQLGQEREPLAVFGAEAFGTARAVAAAAADGVAALAAEPPVLGHLRVGHQRGDGVDARHRGHVDEARAEPAAGGAAGGRAARATAGPTAAPAARLPGAFRPPRRLVGRRERPGARAGRRPRRAGGRARRAGGRARRAGGRARRAGGRARRAGGRARRAGRRARRAGGWARGGAR